MNVASPETHLECFFYCFILAKAGLVLQGESALFNPLTV